MRFGSTDEDLRTRQTQDEQAAVAAGNDFFQFFQENRVWVDEALCASVERLARTFYEAWNQYSDPDEQRGRARETGDAWRRITDEVPAIRTEIERLMRIMLGVLDPPD